MPLSACPNCHRVFHCDWKKHCPNCNNPLIVDATSEQTTAFHKHKARFALPDGTQPR